MWLVNKTTCSLIATVGLAAASFSGCTFLSKASAKTTAKPAAAAAPKPKPESPAAVPEPPLAELQTTAELPAPQPISEETLAALNRLPAPVKETPPPPPPRRLASPVRVEVTAPAPPAPQPAPPPAAKPRIRPAESEAEQRRLRTEIDTWRRETEANLNKARGRPISGEQQNRIDQILGFLDQAGLALKRNELREANSLSSRALLLSKELIGDR